MGGSSKGFCLPLIIILSWVINLLKVNELIGSNVTCDFCLVTWSSPLLSPFKIKSNKFIIGIYKYHTKLLKLSLVSEKDLLKWYIFMQEQLFLEIIN